MIKRNLIITFIFVQIFIIKFSNPTYSRNWIVFPDGTGDAPTIKAAIDSAAAGDSIGVMPGVYDQPIISCSKDSLTIIGVSGAENTFLQNSSAPPGIMDFGQMFRFHRFLRIKGITFQNSAWYAVYVRFYHDVKIENCVFYNNRLYALILECAPYAQVLNNLFYGGDGGIYIQEDMTIAYNTIANNSGEGLWISSEPSGLDIYNNLIVNNGIGIYCWTPNATLTCNNVYGNGSDYFEIADPTGQDGNISVIPDFCAVDPVSTGNYYLQSDSPCAAGNHPDGYECGTIGAYPVGCGTTANREDSWSTIKTRLK